MGITGLIPYLKKAAHEADIRDWKGCTVAIDSYCWLHRGAFACAEKLALGEKTDQYVYYCLKYVNNLLSYGIKPIMVFDGARLPSKEGVEKERRERRKVHRKKAAQLLREGKRSEARDSLQKCIDITPTMALELMKACRAKGVDCIVAPYEADAQLAQLSMAGIAQVIITEDSDLILFGCERVMFKMDFAGRGMMIERKDLNKALDLKPDSYTFDTFRYICILSGCDYLPSLPGIGLAKATKLFRITRQPNIDIVLKKMPSSLNMPRLDMTQEYISGFHRANNTFLHQLVYDPQKRKLLPLHPYSEGLDPRDLVYAGPYMSAEKALQMALGNVDHYSGELIADFNPDDSQEKKSRGNTLHMLSIWDPNYRPKPKISCSKVGPDLHREKMKGKEVVAKFSVIPSKKPSLKRPLPEEAPEDNYVDLEGELISVYQKDTAKKGPPAKRTRYSSVGEDKEDVPPNEPNDIQSFTTTKHSPQRACLQELQEMVDEPPTVEELPPQTPEADPPKEDNVKTGKLTRNVFATSKASNKNRFNLNAKGCVPEVRSRFFVQNSTLKPKTQFFHSLGEPIVVEGDEASVSTASEQESDVKVNIKKWDQDSNANNLACGAKPTCPPSQDREEKLSDSQDKKHSSPLSSFGSWSKLQGFKSSFGSSQRIKSSPLTRKQFKPVTSVIQKSEPISDDDEANTADKKPDLPDLKGFNSRTDLENIADGRTAGETPTQQEKRHNETVPRQSSTPLTYKKGCKSIGLSKGSKLGKTGNSGKAQPLLSNFFNKFAFKKEKS